MVRGSETPMAKKDNFLVYGAYGWYTSFMSYEKE